MGVPTAREAGIKLRDFADPRKAETLLRFFKTGPGQYGEGDRFLGVMVPQTRGVAKLYRGFSFGELSKLLASPWHEERLLALLILVDRVGKNASGEDRRKAFDFYLSHRSGINNWDLVDLSAPQVIGGFLWDHPQERKRLDAWAASTRLWDRRVAIVSTYFLIRQGRFEETLRLSRELLGDPEDLMHKATGWMLREVGKRDLGVLRGFLDREAPRMPRTALRYAIERMRPAERTRYLRIPRKTPPS